jgi:hypothetical protein
MLNDRIKKINKKNLLMQKNGSKNTTIKLTNTNKQIDKNIMLVNYGELFRLNMSSQ